MPKAKSSFRSLVWFDRAQGEFVVTLILQHTGECTDYLTGMQRLREAQVFERQLLAHARSAKW